MTQTGTAAATGWSFYSDRVETNAPAELFATSEVAQGAAVADYLARNPLPECGCAHGCLHWRAERLDTPQRYWLELHSRFTGHTIFAVFAVEESAKAGQEDGADEALKQARWQYGRNARESFRTFVDGDGEEI